MSKTAIDDLPLDGPHWRFAIALYRRAGVADACLLLQDTLSVDVNILLFALYAFCEKGIALNPESIAELDAAIAPWRKSVVGELRAIRRGLKAGPSPAPQPATEILRDQIKSAELRAEQIQQASMALWLARRAGWPAPSGGAAEIVDKVVMFFAERGASRDHARAPEIRLAIDRIVEAASGEQAGIT